VIYIEYVERDRFMPLEIFRYLGNQAAWTAPEDQLVGSFGRTMRIGPMPSYLAFWKCDGMKRMDEWETHFHSDAGIRDTHELATHRAIHLQKAGCYDEVLTGPAAKQDALFYIEYFAAKSAVSNDQIAAHFQKRAKKQSAAALNFVLRRIGRLGPDPGAMAVWSLADYVALEPFTRADLDEDPFRPADIGVYRWFGKEIL
jgi:hypothetical protein